MQDIQVYTNLLENFDGLQKKSAKRRIRSFESTLNDYISLFRRRYSNMQSDAENFNPIELFNLQLDEVTHSRILAWSLDPFETHNQGDLFFKYFLKSISVCIEYEPFNYKVIREYYGMESIIDILVYGNKFILYIENKTTSSEGYNQSNREYKDLLRLAKVINTENYFAIFLSPRGVMPENKNWIPLSYKSLSEEYEKTLNHIKSFYIRQFISSWISILKSL